MGRSGLSLSPRTPTSVSPRKKAMHLSPIHSISEGTSIWTRTSHEYFLQSTPKSFTLDNLEQSLSSIDLESLVLFPEKNINLELQLPSMMDTSQYVNVLIDDLPARPATAMSRASLITERCRTVMQHVRRGLSSAKTSSQAFCGNKGAHYDSDSDEEETLMMGSNSNICISPPTQRPFSRPNVESRTADPSSIYSTDSPCPTSTFRKRRAFYGGDDLAPTSPFTMSSPDASQQTCERASLRPVSSDALKFSPCSAYKQRRKSALAILG